MDINALVTGLVIGLIIGGIISYFWTKNQSIPLKKHQEIHDQNQQQALQLRGLEEQIIQLEKYQKEKTEQLIQKENTLTQLNNQATIWQTKALALEERIEELSQDLASELDANKHQQKEHRQLHQEYIELRVQNEHLAEKLNTQKQEMQELQKTAQLQFEKIANQLLEEKTHKFTTANKANLEQLLNPLKEDINAFKAKVEATHTEDTKQRTSLEERIKGLIEQTNKVSSEANNLASALKGQSQKRGHWGELILERILEASGLTKDREYFIQQNIKNEAGENFRPDVKVILPDHRTIIIDSKVSLIAYEQYTMVEDSAEQKSCLNQHIKTLKKHIDELSEKGYDDLEVNSLDFTMMFVPIEPAYLIAIQQEPDLWIYAYNKRVLLVSPTTLIACLKLFSDLWRREWQNKNAMEIVERGEKLYDKFIGYLQSFEELGKSIDLSQKKYQEALGKLKDGKGNLIGQAEKLKALGLKSQKQISSRFKDKN